MTTLTTSDAALLSDGAHPFDSGALQGDGRGAPPSPWRLVLALWPVEPFMEGKIHMDNGMEWIMGGYGEIFGEIMEWDG